MANWDAIKAWIESPDSYNWLMLAGVIAAVATAISTGYSANSDRLKRRERIIAEWEFDPEGDHIRVTIRIKNGSQTVLTGDRIAVKGPVNDVIPTSSGRREKKGDGWPGEKCWMNISIRPGETGVFTFVILPNPKKLRQSASSRLGSPRAWLGKALWHSLGWRLEFGPKFSMTSRLRKRSSPMRPIRFAAVRRIYDPIAIKMADKVDEAAQTK